jgi:hypothetical protein
VSSKRNSQVKALRRQVHRLRAAEAAGRLAGGEHKSDLLPSLAEIADELGRLTRCRWNRPADIRVAAPMLLRFHATKAASRAFVPDPNADVHGLRRFLRDTTRYMSNLEQSRRDLQQQARIAEDLLVGKPARLLLGLAEATKNSKIGERREAAAAARGVAPETVRRSHARLICEETAEVALSREAQRTRSSHAFG